MRISDAWSAVVSQSLSCSSAWRVKQNDLKMLNDEVLLSFSGATDLLRHERRQGKMSWCVDLCNVDY